MTMTDPIADMLTRIRNAIRVGKKTVDVPASRLKEGILDVLKREGFIEDYKTGESGAVRTIRVWLKYSRLGESVIREIRRESKPGRRIYRPVEEIKPVLRGTGIAVVSTSRGILSDRECRRQHVGGEVLCRVW